MIDNIYRTYEDFNKFIEEFLFTVMENGHAVIMVNYKDYQGIIENLNGRVLNGKSLVTDIETAELFDEDVKTAMEHDGNMMITCYNNLSLIVGEPVIFPNKAISFIDSIYFVEENAVDKARTYDIPSAIIPFMINKLSVQKMTK